MRAGAMRFTAEFHNPTQYTDSTGQEGYTYSLYKKTFVGIVRDSMDKNETGFIQASGHEDVTLQTRYDAHIGYNTRVYWNGTWYKINKVDNVMNLNHKLELGMTAVDI